MPRDNGEVCELSNLDHLAVKFGDVINPLPNWAKWIVWLGQWLRIQVSCPGRRVAILRIPTRRTAAAFASLGVLMASARLHDDSLDWKRLGSLVPGTKVFWRQLKGGRPRPFSGEVVGVQIIDDQEFLVLSVDNGRSARPATHSFARNAALNLGITLGAVSSSAGDRLIGAENLVKAAVDGCQPSWFRSLTSDCVVVTQRTTFLEELGDSRICAGSNASAAFVDAMLLAGTGGRAHGKTTLVSVRQRGVLDAANQVTILDGAAAVLRMSDTSAGSVLAILDPAEHDEEVEQVLMTFMGSASDAFVQRPPNGLSALPPSAEIAVFGVSSVGQPST